MELFERVKAVAKLLAGSDKALGEKLSLRQNTFSYYLSQKTQGKLWELLPKILEIYPQIRRDWLYFDEGEMLKSDKPDQFQKNVPVSPHGRLAAGMDYFPQDALGRIAALTNIRTSSALELQMAFGVDFKEIKLFLARYQKARAERAEWLAGGGSEEEMPPAPEFIPEEWLNYFWNHFGPNPGWIQYGDSEGSNAPTLLPTPQTGELDRLRSELAVAQKECERLRIQLERSGNALAQEVWTDLSDKGACMPEVAPSGIKDSN